MSTYTEALTDVFGQIRAGSSRGGAAVADGLYLTAFSATVVNIAGRTRKLQLVDVEGVHSGLIELGFVVVDVWVAQQGLSWVSSGVESGVSFRVRRPVREPLISEATIAEAAAMEERDRLAGGPPWEVEDHPDNRLPGGWHHGQITGNPAKGWD